jgi:hypothetical protein
MTKGRRRGFKSWFVEPYQQVRLGIWFLLINCIFAGLIFAIYGYYVIEVYQAVTMYFQISGAESAQVFAKFRVPLAVGIGLIVGFILTTILVSVRLTHGYYGPLVSINRFLDEFLSGQVPSPIQLRDSDQLKDLVEKLNRLPAQIQNTHEGRQQLVAIQKYLHQIIEGRDSPLDGSDKDFLLADIAKKIRKIRSEPPMKR